MNKKLPIPQWRSNTLATSLQTEHAELAQRVDRFLGNTDLARWYKRYEWNCDKWAENDGFACIFKMESDFRIKLTGKRGLSTEDCRRIAFWGKHRRPCSVCVKKAPDLSKLRREAAVGALVKVYECVRKGVSNFGPTYASKALRFLSPQQCGAIDTRLVKEFGKKGLAWLDWSVTNAKSSYGPFLSDNLEEYKRWQLILRYIASSLNFKKRPCPHPRMFTKSGLRKKNVWYPADVEMALFAYATAAGTRIRGK